MTRSCLITAMAVAAMSTVLAKDATHLIQPSKPTENLPKHCKDASKLCLPEARDKAKGLTLSLRQYMPLPPTYAVISTLTSQVTKEAEKVHMLKHYASILSVSKHIKASPTATENIENLL